MEFPSKCPYCGKDTVQNYIGSLPDKYGNPKIGTLPDIWVEAHDCVHCHRPIFLFMEKDTQSEISWMSKICYIIPPSKFIDYPKQVMELSKNAYEFYSQAIKAKELGLDKLVGAGLRSALEWLTSDYLIKVKGYTEEKAAGLSLYDRIEKIDGDRYKKVCGHILRKFGNDSVHIVKQIDFTVDDALPLYGIMIDIIDTELTLIEAGKRLKEIKP